MNYRKHAQEAGVSIKISRTRLLEDIANDASSQLTVPTDPVMWYKPRKALGGPGNVFIPKVAAAAFLDFEVSDNSSCCWEIQLNFR